MKPLRVPGVLGMTSPDSKGTHTIELGPLAGLGGGAELRWWKQTVSFVVLADLTPAQRLGVAPLVAYVDPDLEGSSHYRSGASYPNLRRHFANVRLAAVDEDTPLPKGPHRLVEVGFDRTADDYFLLSVVREGKTLVRIEGACGSLRGNAEALGADRFDESTVAIEDRRFLDRVLRAATAGLVDEVQIELAAVYGFGAEPKPDDLAREEARCTATPEDTTLAREILARIENAGDAETIELPDYGQARRVRLPARVLRDSGSSDPLDGKVDIEGARELALPAEDVWTIFIEPPPYVPPPRPPVRSPRSSSRLRWGLAALLGLLVVLVVLKLLVGC